MRRARLGENVVVNVGDGEAAGLVTKEANGAGCGIDAVVWYEAEALGGAQIADWRVFRDLSYGFDDGQFHFPGESLA